MGGTVGSGVFVLAGEIANSETLPAGPSVTLSFLFSGIACALSGLSFAELASRIHQDGSSYAYAYVTLGEVFAFVAGCCLTLEYGVSSAAVARAFGDKLGAWIAHLRGEDPAALPPSLWRPAADGVNIYAGMIEAACLLIMLRGLGVSKLTVDVFTLLKLVLVAGMTVGGFALYRPGHMRPFAPSGMRGVFRGSMRCFFGYLGKARCYRLVGSAGTRGFIPDGMYASFNPTYCSQGTTRSAAWAGRPRTRPPMYVCNHIHNLSDSIMSISPKLFLRMLHQLESFTTHIHNRSPSPSLAPSSASPSST